MTTAHEKPFKFKVDDKDFTDLEDSINGAHIRQLAEIPASYQLFLEVPGEGREDRLINNDDIVNLAEPGIEKLYTLPPATFGCRGYR
jgi:hypothetical protein